MSKQNHQLLKDAYKLLYRELGGKKYDCKSFGFNCPQCNFQRFLEDFKSLNDFILKD